MDLELSQFHFHSWGFVTENKPIMVPTVKVLPIEFRFNQAEVLLDNPTDFETSFETEFGEDAIQVTLDRSVECMWWNLNSNRVTAPDVRRGDPVIIMRLGNTDRYYWSDINSGNLKRLETQAYAWSADPKNPIAPDLSNAYSLEISSHFKNITLRTSMANEEPFSYVFELDLAKGRFTVTDNIDNNIMLDSSENIIQMSNADGTEVRLDKLNYYMTVPDSAYIDVANTIDIKCTDLRIKASNSIAMTTKAWTVEADTIDFKNKTMTVTCDSATYTSPKVTVTGLLTCGGLSVGGAGSTKSGGLCVVNNFAEFKAGLEVKGGLKVDTIECDSIKAKTGSFDSHGTH